MKTKIHALAGVIAFLTILTFWVSTAYTELFGTPENIATVKSMVLNGMFVLIPAMIIAGGSGMALGGKRVDAKAAAKKKRMPFIASNGLLILVPAAFYLESKAAHGAFDTQFYLVQVVELMAGAVNLTLLGLNIRDGLTMTGRISEGTTKRMDDNGVVIEAKEGGALIVKGLKRLIDGDGKPLKQKPVTALCRCGASQSKPYCDGSHNEIGFDSSCSADATPDQLQKFDGTEISIHYNRLLCSHAAVCTTRLKPVFDNTRKPWIIPDNGTAEEAIDIVKACPSGALSYSLDGHEPQHAVGEIEGITIEKNGPYRVVDIPLVSPRLAQGACDRKQVLCRCGASKNKPYCDGSHYDIKWRDDTQGASS